MYPFLRKGDRLPTVATAQILLNRKLTIGTYIEVDGIFGKNTKKAVKEFQMVRGLGMSGNVDRGTWAALIRDEALQVIDSVDVTNAKDMGYEDTAIAAAGGKPILNFGMCMGVKDATTKIEMKAHQGKVVLLRFHGHGSPGYMGISVGTGDEVSSEFGVTFLESLARYLQRLAPIFSPLGSAELHGCRVGAGRDGKRLLSALADAWGIPVTAGIKTQYGGGSSTFRFEGPTATRCPGNVSLRKWAKSIKVPEVYGMSVWR